MSYKISQAYNVLKEAWTRNLYDMFGLEQYLLHQEVIQCFKSYMWNGIEILKHSRGFSGIFSGPQKRMMWLSEEADRICIGEKKVIDTEDVQKAGGLDAIKGEMSMMKAVHSLAILRSVATLTHRYSHSRPRHR